MDIRAGTLTAIYLFDVAEQIDVPAMRRLLGGGATSRLPSKSTAPLYACATRLRRSSSRARPSASLWSRAFGRV